MPTMNSYILGSRPRYQVVAPVVIVQTLSGQVELGRRALLPLDTLPAHIEHLESFGMIRKVEGTGR